MSCPPSPAFFLLIFTSLRSLRLPSLRLDGWINSQLFFSCSSSLNTSYVDIFCYILAKPTTNFQLRYSLLECEPPHVSSESASTRSVLLWVLPLFSLVLLLPLFSLNFSYVADVNHYRSEPHLHHTLIRVQMSLSSSQAPFTYYSTASSHLTSMPNQNKPLRKSPF